MKMSPMARMRLAFSMVNGVSACRVRKILRNWWMIACATASDTKAKPRIPSRISGWVLELRLGEAETQELGVESEGSSQVVQEMRDSMTPTDSMPRSMPPMATKHMYQARLSATPRKEETEPLPKYRMVKTPLQISDQPAMVIEYHDIYR